jgi:hypothetical protein
MRKFASFLLLAGFFLQPGTTNAQSTWLGIKGGLSIPDLSGGNGNQLSSDYTSRLAANFGLLSEYRVENHFSIQVELNYAGQGGKRDGMQPITNLPPSLASQVPPGSYLYADFNNKAVLDYLELPVLAKVTWGRLSGFYINAGPYFGYLLKGTEKTSGTSEIYADPHGQEVVDPQPTSFDANTNITSSIHRFNVGVTGGAGLFCHLDRNDKLFLDARFEYGLINIQKYSQDGSNNTGNLLLSLGYAHRFGGRK